MGAFGDKLKREREMRRISLDEISESTKIPRRYLESLERENFESMPGGVFNKGFVKAYARFLGLDEEQAVADYVAVAKEEAPPEDQFPLEIHEKPDREMNPRKSKLPLIGAVVALVGVLAGYAVWRGRIKQTENAENTVAAASPSESGTRSPEKSSNAAQDTPVPAAAMSQAQNAPQRADYKHASVVATPVIKTVESNKPFKSVILIFVSSITCQSVIHQAPDAAVRAGAEVTEERQQHSARGEDALRGTVSTGFGNPPCHPVRRWVSAGGRGFL